jgi:hypothetical protein
VRDLLGSMIEVLVLVPVKSRGVEEILLRGDGVVRCWIKSKEGGCMYLVLYLLHRSKREIL